MDDMMNMMMGGGGGGGQRRRRKGRDVGLAFPVSLEDLYNGKKTEVPREKTVMCPGCKGTGSSKPGVSAVCSGCQGQGAKVVMRQIGPGMMQQARVPCNVCNGRGSNLQEKDKCRTCYGARTKTGEEALHVTVEKGMEHNQQIPFAGEGDQDPEIDVPGDIVIVLQQLKHDTHTRDENDLHMKKKLSLAEAICGFQFNIKQLDGRTLVVRSEPGTMLQPGDKKCIRGEGMPVWQAPNKFGDLVIEFEITFPERLEDSAMATLRTALPPPATAETNFDGEETEECFVSRQPLDEMRKEMAKEDDDDEDEEGGQGQGGVRCAQQ